MPSGTMAGAAQPDLGARAAALRGHGRRDRWAPLRRVWSMLRDTFTDYIEDGCLSRGAAIAYYTVLSIGPVLVICIAIAGLVFGHDAAQGAIVGQLRGLMGQQAAELVQTTIRSAGDHRRGLTASLLGLGTLVLTASGVFGEMQAALNAIWKAESKGGSLSAILKARAASLGLVAALGFLLMVSLVISAVLGALGDYLNRVLPFASLVLRGLNLVISLGLITVLFAAVFKILPDRQLSWRDMWVGAFTTALLFSVGKMLIGLYIGSSAIASSYGAAGALVVVLIWIYYSSQIFLLGAEFTKAWAANRGKPEAWAVRTAQGAVAPAPSKVENIVARTATRRRLGVFELAALATLILFVNRRQR